MGPTKNPKTEQKPKPPTKSKRSLKTSSKIAEAVEEDSAEQISEGHKLQLFERTQVALKAKLSNKQQSFSATYSAPLRQCKTDTSGTIIKEEEEEKEEPVQKNQSAKKRTRSASKEDLNDHSTRPPKRKRKTKEEKEFEAMPLAVRTSGLRMFVGAHVSAAKGIYNAIPNTVHIGGNALALFLKSQRKWENPPLLPEHALEFKTLCSTHNYDAAKHILPHGSYLVNLAHEDPDRARQAYTAFLDDLKRCETLGIKLYNFHPGAAGTSPLPSALQRIAAHINAAHRATSSVTPLLETMAGGGTTIGSRFSDLAGIISLVEDKSRIGVCLDTCHVFASGHDLRTPETFAATLTEFDRVVGLPYLKALHLNDSKTPLGSGRDRHANIGVGFLGLGAFWNIMNEQRFEGLPMVLETPIDEGGDSGEKKKEDKGVWATEVKLLEGLVGMDKEGPEFRRFEEELAARGQEGREKEMGLFEKKKRKAEAAALKGEKEKKKKTEQKDEGSESEES